MHASDVEQGRRTTLELRPSIPGGFGHEIPGLSEAGLIVSDMGDSLILQIGDRSWDVEGIDARQRDLAEQMTSRNLPRVAWVAATIPPKGKDPASVVVELREFPVEYFWPETVDIGVDEKILDSLRKERKSIDSIQGAVAWLEEKVLIRDRDGMARALLSGSPTPQSAQRSGFTLHGKGIAVDIARVHGDLLNVVRVAWGRRPTSNDEKRPVFLVRGKMRFIDYTIAGQFTGKTRSQLDQLVQESDSYLKLWGEYNKLERQSIIGRAREFGCLRYKSRQSRGNGVWRFMLEGVESPDESLGLLRDDVSNGFQLEAAEEPPPELSGELGAEAGGGRARNRSRAFVGEYAGIDRHRNSIDLRPMDDGAEEPSPPPEKGFLFISLGGDRTRLRRREDAHAMIVSAECKMPQLGLIIEGRKVRERRRKQEKPLSPAARSAFGAEPTGRQVKALKIALNTPDIALIQGPPGTGKTRVIAALQARLADIERDYAFLSGSALLSSEQHDAVENVASATNVLGLPAIKIGRRRGQREAVDEFERWCRDRVEAVNAQLANVPEKPVATALRNCRDLAVGYRQAPPRPEDVAKFIGEVRALAGPHITPQLDDELLRLQQRMRDGDNRAGGDDIEREMALKAVRGLRVGAVAFADDGSMQARKALRRLEGLGILNDNERAILSCAEAWEGDEEPGFLDDLGRVQQALIDRLLPDAPTAKLPSVNADVEAMLGAVLDALSERTRTTRAGVEAALYQYRDDLEKDPCGARDSVMHYTAVLAATCQQCVGKQMSRRKNDDIEFDTVVVDEAARANPLDLLIPMACAKRRIVLVGDQRQLPHILDYEIERELDRNADEQTRLKLHESLFKHLFELMRKRECDDGIVRTVTLDVQYRMHPVLGDFVSDTFYRPYPGEAFTSGRPATDFPHDLKPYGKAVAAWVDIPLSRGRESGRRSKRRAAEAKWIAEEVHRILTERPEFSVGVITFYAAQVDELMQHMERCGLTEQGEDGQYGIAPAWRDTRDGYGRLKERLRVGTVDAFQGKEFDVVVLSMTRSNDHDASNPRGLLRKYGHLVLENRLCVAMSRQKRLLIVVGDAGMLTPHEAASAISGLVRFHELCRGNHGIQIRA